MKHCYGLSSRAGRKNEGSVYFYDQSRISIFMYLECLWNYTAYLSFIVPAVRYSHKEQITRIVKINIEMKYKSHASCVIPHIVVLFM